MSENNPPSVPDAAVWPTSPKEIVISYFAECVWNEPSVIDALGNILITFKEYGIVHLHVAKTLAPLLTLLGKKPSLAKFAKFPQSEPLCIMDTILESEVSAKGLNSTLQKHLRNSGVLQKGNWNESQGVKPTLPIVPWLLYLSAKNPETAIQITPSTLSKILAADKGLPLWLRKQFKPTDCDRYVQRFREAIAMIRGGRQQRFAEAGGLESKIAIAHPGLAIMYPKSLIALGPKLLDLEELKAVLNLIPLQILKRRYKEQGLVIDVKPAPKPIPLSQLALMCAGINPKEASIEAMMGRIPRNLRG